MKVGSTDIVVILDGSASMRSLFLETVTGLNDFINEQAKQPGECTITLVQFRGGETYRVVIPKTDVTDCPRVSEANYRCAGMTPLNECVCKTIDKKDEELATLSEEQRPERIVVVIITDGAENASAMQYVMKDENGLNAVQKRVQHQKDVYNWDFIFLGKDIAAIEEGAKVGVDADNAADFQSVKRATKRVSEKLVRYRASGLKEALQFNDLDRANM